MAPADLPIADVSAVAEAHFGVGSPGGAVVAVAVPVGPSMPSTRSPSIVPLAQPQARHDDGIEMTATLDRPPMHIEV